MADRDIYKMLNDLVNRVELLENQLIKQKRENANLLEELEAKSSSGVSSSFVGQVDKKFSEIMQTEEKIQTTVADLSDDTRKKFSQVTQTAEGITMEVSTFYNEIEGLKDGDEYDPTKYPELYESSKGNMLSYKGDNYYYSSISKKWKKTNVNSVSSSFVMGSDGFTLNGDVAINGNTYQNGFVYVTGKGNNEGSAIYVCNGSIDKKVGFISYDTNGNNTYESKNRMIIAANGGNALKILTYNTGNVENPKVENISIGAGMWGGNGEITEYSGYGYVYVDSPIVFSKYAQGDYNPLKDRDVIFQDGCRVDFSGATVTGLYAVFE